MQSKADYMEDDNTERKKPAKLTAYKYKIQSSSKVPLEFESLNLPSKSVTLTSTNLSVKQDQTRSFTERGSRPKSEDLNLSLKIPAFSQGIEAYHSEIYQSRSLVDLSTDSKEKSFIPNTKALTQGFVKLRKKVQKSSPTTKPRFEKASTFYIEKNQSTSKLLRPLSSPLPNMRSRNSDSYSTLLDALESKKMRTAFLDFLESEYSSENLCFWLSCEKFRKLKSEDQRFKEGQSIYSRYISPNSPLQINIDHVTRRQITIAMTCGVDDVTADVFNRAQSKVFSIMENDSFPRFVNSNFFKDALPSKKNTLESVFSTILPNSLSPTKPTSKWLKNSNNNNSKGGSSPSEAQDKTRFFFGFKKTNI